MHTDEVHSRLKVVEMEALGLLLKEGDHHAQTKYGNQTKLLVGLVALTIAVGSIGFSVICSTPLTEREYCKNPMGGGECEWTHATSQSGECVCIEQACYGFGGWASGTAAAINSDLWNGFYLTVVTVTTIGYGDLYPQSADGRSFMIVYVTVVLGVLAYLLNFFIGGSDGAAHESDLVKDFAHANTESEWRATVLSMHSTEHNADEVEGLLKADYSKKSLGPEPNVMRASFKLVASVVVFVLVSSLSAFLLHWYVGWSFIASFYFTWYTASTVGFGDYGGFECVRPSRFPEPFIGTFDVDRVNASNTSPIEGSCRTPDSDAFAKFLVIVVILISIGAMSVVIAMLQKLVEVAAERVLYQHRYHELKNSMRRAAFKLIQIHFDDLDEDGGGELSMDELSDFLLRQGLELRHIKKLMVELDEDKSGDLSKEEIDHVCALLERDTFREMVVRFREVDENGDHILDIDDLPKVMPVGTPTADIKAMRDRLDATGDGVITLETILKFAESDSKWQASIVKKHCLRGAAPFGKALLFICIREAFVHLSAVVWMHIGKYTANNTRVYQMGSAPLCPDGMATCTDADLYPNDWNVGDPWTYIDSLYFVAITTSTVGFGDFSPSTDFGRLFCVVWGTVGIAVHLMTVDACVQLLHTLISPAALWFGLLQTEFFDAVLKQKRALACAEWRSTRQLRKCCCCACEEEDISAAANAVDPAVDAVLQAARTRRKSTAGSYPTFEMQVAAALHSLWQSKRTLLPNGSRVARVKLVGGVEHDIANSDFFHLPKELQASNVTVARIACHDVCVHAKALINARQHIDGGTLKAATGFIHRAASNVHKQWCTDNISWADPSKLVPYAELSAFDKEQNSDIVKLAVQIYNDRMEAGVPTASASENEVLDVAADYARSTARSGRPLSVRVRPRAVDVDVEVEDEQLVTTPRQKVLDRIRCYIGLVLNPDPAACGRFLEAIVVITLFWIIQYGGGKVVDELGTEAVSQPESYMMQNFLTTIGFGDFKAETLEQKIFFCLLCVPGHTITTACLMQLAQEFIFFVTNLRGDGRHSEKSAKGRRFDIEQDWMALPPMYKVGAGARHALDVMQREMLRVRADNARGVKPLFAVRRPELFFEHTEKLIREEEQALGAVQRVVRSFDASNATRRKSFAYVPVHARTAPPPVRLAQRRKSSANKLSSVDAADDATRSAVGADSNETKVAFDTANPMRDAMRAAAALRARAKNAVVEEAAATKGMGEKKKSRFLSMRLEARDQAEVAPSKVPPLSPSRATIRERSPARSPVRSPAVRAAPAPNTDDSSSMDENY
jgi:Ca2+-binding EF-hand superfamily protein